MIDVRPLLLFDLDDTLVDHSDAARRAIRGWISDAGFPPQVNGVSSERIWHDIAESHFREYFAGRMGFAEQRRRRVAQFLERMNVAVDHLPASDLDDYFSEYRRRYEDAWRLFPDVMDALVRLAPTHRLAILTNGDQRQQLDKVQRTGLAPLIEKTIATSSIGVAKPDPEAFHRALSTLDARAESSIYVGDQLETDARAAQAAALTGVWLNRGSTPASEGPQVRVITTLAELP